MQIVRYGAAPDLFHARTRTGYHGTLGIPNSDLRIPRILPFVEWSSPDRRLFRQLARVWPPRLMNSNYVQLIRIPARNSPRKPSISFVRSCRRCCDVPFRSVSLLSWSYRLVFRFLGKEVIGEKGVFGEVGARGIDSKCTTLRARVCTFRYRRCTEGILLRVRLRFVERPSLYNPFSRCWVV